MVKPKSGLHRSPERIHHHLLSVLSFAPTSFPFRTRSERRTCHGVALSHGPMRRPPRTLAPSTEGLNEESWLHLREVRPVVRESSVTLRVRRDDRTEIIHRLALLLRTARRSRCHCERRRTSQEGEALARSWIGRDEDHLRASLEPTAIERPKASARATISEKSPESTPLRSYESEHWFNASQFALGLQSGMPLSPGLELQVQD